MTNSRYQFRIVLVRHGATEWSRIGRYTGRTDLVLQPEGEAAAVALGPELEALGPFAAVLVSPLARARRTCDLAGFGDRAVVTPDLAEWDYGADEGRTKAEILVEDPAWDLWRDGPHGGEPLADLAARVGRVLHVARQAGGDVLCFAHGHSLRTLAAVWLGLDPSFGNHLHLDPTTVSVLGWEHGRPALIEWNAGGSRPRP